MCREKWVERGEEGRGGWKMDTHSGLSFVFYPPFKHTKKAKKGN